MSDYRWEGSPYQPTANPAIAATVVRLELLERALYKIALDAKSLEDAKHIACETLFRQSSCTPQ